MMLVTTGILLAMAAGAADGQPAEKRFQGERVLMGVSFKIVLYAPNETAANRGLEAAFDRIAALNRVLSDYDPQSELSHLSRTAPTDRPQPLSPDLWRVLARSQEISRLSDGAFDVTVGPLTKLWRRARRRKSLPPDDQLAAARAAVGFRHLRLDEKAHAAELLVPTMRLDLGGIAKGYAADEALAVLRKAGLPRALVNGSGDLTIGDPPPGQRGWKIGVAPLGPDEAASRYLWLAHCGVATSGDAWQHVEINNVRYSHIVDPATGLGLTDRSGVTVVAPDGMTADALASAVSVLGPKKGLALIERLPKTAALVVRAPDGKVETHASQRFDKLPQTEK